MSYLQVAKKSLDEIRKGTTPACGGRLQAGGQSASGVPEFDADEFAAMPISEFARAGLVVKIYSGELGCEVLLASDNVPDSEIPDPGLAVYRADEMRKLALWRPDPADLRRVHAVKEVFRVYDATIRSIDSREDRNRKSQPEGAKKAKEAKKASEAARGGGRL